jgi:acetoacetyl-CoA synthetase
MESDRPSNGPIAEKLWEPQNPESTELYKFMRHINAKYSLNLSSYDDIYRWSISRISDFWGEVWYYTGMVGSTYTEVSHYTVELSYN